MESLLEEYGEGIVLMTTGGLIGLIFGVFAFHSSFCLRAATVELAQGQFGPKLAIWLISFFTALLAVQCAVYFELIEVSNARQLSATGSLSGAIIGGIMFGIGMILARGCASRLLVLSASGNLRALITGLVLTLTAQAALRGALAPPREALATLWKVEGGESRSLITILPFGITEVIGISAIALMGSIILGKHRALTGLELTAAAGIGLTIALGWGLTYWIAMTSFEVVPVQSITFTGPSADTLMALVNERELSASFGIGLVPGVFVGVLLIALIKGEARIQRFEPDTPMERYLLGGVLMGFGSMLAGGCAVGAVVSGGSILAITAWLTAVSMWMGAVATQLVLSRNRNVLAISR